MVSAEFLRGDANTGKTLFAQLMDFLPWTTFTRIVAGMGSITGSGRFPAPCNTGHAIPGKPARHRDASRSTRSITWAPPAGPALDVGRCQRKARGVSMPVGPAAHHPGEDCTSTKNWGCLTNTVYALETPSLCAASFRSPRRPHAARVRGNIPIRREAGAIYRVIVATSTLPAFMFFVTRAMLSASIRADGSLDRHHLRPDHGRPHPSGLPRTSAGMLQGPRVRQDAGLHHQQLLAWPPPSARSTRWQVELFFKIKLFGSSRWHVENAVADLDCRLGLRPRSSRSASTWTPRSGPLGDPLRVPIHQALAGDENRCNAQITNLFEFIRLLAGCSCLCLKAIRR